MKLQKDSIFFSELDKIAVYEERLKFLSGGSKEEKVYLLHMIGKWMREDANCVHRRAKSPRPAKLSSGSA